jgi:hypothetical protein
VWATRSRLIHYTACPSRTVTRRGTNVMWLISACTVTSHEAGVVMAVLVALGCEPEEYDDPEYPQPASSTQKPAADR